MIYDWIYPKYRHNGHTKVMPGRFGKADSQVLQQTGPSVCLSVCWSLDCVCYYVCQVEMCSATWPSIMTRRGQTIPGHLINNNISGQYRIVYLWIGKHWAATYRGVCVCVCVCWSVFLCPRARARVCVCVCVCVYLSVYAYRLLQLTEFVHINLAELSPIPTK